MTELSKKLTKPQKIFLEDYFDNIMSGDFDFRSMEKQEFIERVSKMDFDDGCSRDVGWVRVGKNLNERGFFDEFDVHGTIFDLPKTQGHIYLSFSVAGAEVMWELMTEALEAGRLQIPEKAALRQ